MGLAAGRLPIEPSKATVFKTNDFGLGHARPDLLDKLSMRHPDVMPKPLLMPNKYREKQQGRLGFDVSGI